MIDTLYKTADTEGKFHKNTDPFYFGKRCNDYSETGQEVAYALGKLSLGANHLWKFYLPDRLDYVFGKIWLQYQQIGNALANITTADILAGIGAEDNEANENSNNNNSGDDENELFNHPVVHALVSNTLAPTYDESDERFDLSRNPYLKDAEPYPELTGPENKISDQYWHDIRTVGYGRNNKYDLHVKYNNPFDPRLYFHGIIPHSFPKTDMGPLPKNGEENLFLKVNGISDMIEHHTTRYRLALQSLTKPYETTIPDVGDESGQELVYRVPRIDAMSLAQPPQEHYSLDPDSKKVLEPIFHNNVKLVWLRSPRQCATAGGDSKPIYPIQSSCKSSQWHQYQNSSQKDVTETSESGCPQYMTSFNEASRNETLNQMPSAKKAPRESSQSDVRQSKEDESASQSKTSVSAVTGSKIPVKCAWDAGNPWNKIPKKSRSKELIQVKITDDSSVPQATGKLITKSLSDTDLRFPGDPYTKEMGQENGNNKTNNNLSTSSKSSRQSEITHFPSHHDFQTVLPLSTDYQQPSLHSDLQVAAQHLPSTAQISAMYGMQENLPQRNEKVNNDGRQRICHPSGAYSFSGNNQQILPPLNTQQPLRNIAQPVPPQWNRMTMSSQSLHPVPPMPQAPAGQPSRQQMMYPYPSTPGSGTVNPTYQRPVNIATMGHQMPHILQGNAGQRIMNMKNSQQNISNAYKQQNDWNQYALYGSHQQSQYQPGSAATRMANQYQRVPPQAMGAPSQTYSNMYTQFRHPQPPQFMQPIGGDMINTNNSNRNTDASSFLSYVKEQYGFDTQQRQNNARTNLVNIPMQIKANFGTSRKSVLNGQQSYQGPAQGTDSGHRFEQNVNQIRIPRRNIQSGSFTRFSSMGKKELDPMQPSFYPLNVYVNEFVPKEQEKYESRVEHSSLSRAKKNFTSMPDLTELDYTDRDDEQSSSPVPEWASANVNENTDPSSIANLADMTEKSGIREWKCSTEQQSTMPQNLDSPSKKLTFAELVKEIMQTNPELPHQLEDPPQMSKYDPSLIRQMMGKARAQKSSQQLNGRK